MTSGKKLENKDVCQKMLKLIWFFVILSGLSLLPINAQPTENLIKKLPDGRKLYQRKQETSIPNQSNSENQDRICLKVEAVLKNSQTKQEEVVWFKEISFDKNERTFNNLYISDIYVKENEIYLLYFEYLDMQVVKLFEDANQWHFENDTFLEKTSESIYPIIESKFIGKKPKIVAKKLVDGLQTIEYKWKLKKEKWILSSKKVIKIKPIRLKQK